MALNRTLNFVLRHGELDVDVANKASYSYVGGSPVAIDTDGLVSATIGSETAAVGIAANALEADDDQEDKGTIYFAPGIYTLEAESSGVADGIKPFKIYGSPNWSVGDLIRPMQATGTPAYAVWTNDEYTSEQSNCQYVYYGKVLNVAGTANNPTSLTILFQPTVKIKS